MTIITRLSFIFMMLLSGISHAQLSSIIPNPSEPQVRTLTPMDKQYLEQQRRHIDGMARMRLGANFRGDKYADLALLQRLLDSRLVKSDDRKSLQAMGVILGDILARELGMQWIVYEDDKGRSRALKLYRDDQILFPITMISRRAEVGIKVDVRAVYDKAYKIMKPNVTPAPYT